MAGASASAWFFQVAGDMHRPDRPAFTIPWHPAA
jgi:hypothetical protein